MALTNNTRRRGFSLLEIMGVIFLLALLLGLGLPYLARMRANTTINTNAERMAGFLTQSQGQAKTFGVPILQTCYPRQRRATPPPLMVFWPCA